MKRPPRGLAAIPWRLPIWLYRLHLGWLLRERFLLLTHTGRKSGLPRQAVLEVIHHDPQTRTWYVASGFGEKSQWFRNVMKTPQVSIQVGRRKMTAEARRLPLEEAERILQRYAGEHPVALRELTRLMGAPYDGSPESLRRMAEQIPVVALQEA
ncbi:MAG TPA: nitroreductase family deazaflavin-dependent oxidoreductase [Chloroflexi bacterium]|nr:nitroreductase family deazaflavin-dependent oxidoreductase [Chloroflexota bacterium]